MAKLTHSQVVAGLVARGVPQHVAEGVAMNFRDESNFNTAIRGDNGNAIGLAQWNGPRMARLGAFAQSQGKAIDDPDAQLDFFMHENATNEREAWSHVVNSNTPQEAAVKFVNLWERPAEQHARSRSAKYGGADAASFSAAPTNPNVGSTIDFKRAATEAETGKPSGTPSAFPDAGDYSTPPAVAPLTLPEADKKMDEHWLQSLGKGIGNIKFNQGKGPSIAPTPEAARLDAGPGAPLVAAKDPNRMQLAQLMMQRLNTGRLF